MAAASVKKGPKRSKNRSNKLHLVFDENKRRDFLLGFHKRKLQRKKEAKEKWEKELKEERKRLKNDAKESYKKLIVSHRSVPEVEHLLEKQYEEDDVTVKVVELSTNDIAKCNNWIGDNQPKCESDSENDLSGDQQEVKEDVPGMELKPRQKTKEKIPRQKFQSEKEVKKILKKQATQNVKKSKVFQRKNAIEKQKQKRKSVQLKKQKFKIHNKNVKRKKSIH